MAKILLNSALGGLRGRVDGWVYRKQNGGIVVARRPDFTGVAPTEAQLAVRLRFQQAAAYGRRAVADPALREVYTALAAEQYSNAYAVAVTDCLKAPVVDAIDLAGFHGAVGDPIAVTAHDDTEVMGVTVLLRDPAGAILEQGDATLVDGLWKYAATTAIPPGTSVTVEAIATDRPGNRAGKTVPWPA